MLVALSPSLNRLHMPSLDFRSDATASYPNETGTHIADGGALPTTIMDANVASISKTRPKLSLQTSSLPSPYAKSSKGVLGSASVLLGAATPTTSNTIANTIQLIPLRPSPSTPKLSCNRPLQVRPYTQPIGLRSILKNGSESLKLGMKRSHSLFSAESGSPHTKRRVFFPPVKKVKFEGEEKLNVEILAQDSSSSEGPRSSTGEAEVLESKATALQKASDEQEAADTASIIVVPDVRGAPRTRNGTPPPEAIPPRKKQKVRNWEWTITSPKLPKQGDRT